MRNRTRRQFVKEVGATAVLLGAPLPRGLFPLAPARETEERTLFFNLSHLKGRATTHFLYLAGRKYRMTSVAERPDVLALERRRNEFLASVPDDQITHHVQGALVPKQAMALAYSTSDENSVDGTWAMTSMFFQLPLAAVTHASRGPARPHRWGRCRSRARGSATSCARRFPSRTCARSSRWSISRATPRRSSACIRTS